MQLHLLIVDQIYLVPRRSSLSTKKWSLLIRSSPSWMCRVLEFLCGYRSFRKCSSRRRRRSYRRQKTMCKSMRTQEFNSSTCWVKQDLTLQTSETRMKRFTLFKQSKRSIPFIMQTKNMLRGSWKHCYGEAYSFSKANRTGSLSEHHDVECTKRSCIAPMRRNQLSKSKRAAAYSYHWDILAFLLTTFRTTIDETKEWW